MYQHPVSSAHRQARQQHRRRLVIAGERPGRLPEQGLQQVHQDRQPPFRDHLPWARAVPGERDVRERPGQPRSDSQYEASGVRPSRASADDQRIRHDPRRSVFSPAFLQRRVHDRLDDAVAEIALQLAQPHGSGSHRPPAPSRPGGSPPGPSPPAENAAAPRAAEHGPGHDRPATAKPQVSGPHHDSPRRCPRHRGPLSRIRQRRRTGRMRAGLQEGQGFDTRTPTRSPTSCQNSPEPSSQP